MLKKLRYALRTPEKKSKAIILIAGLIILMLALTVGALKVTSMPAFCITCHEMAPEYYTWENSAHNKIDCASCHIKPGFKNLLVHQIGSLTKVYPHFAQSFVTPIALKEKIANYQCDSCHDMTKRETTPSGDIKFDHIKHSNQKLDCVECHSGVAHGNIEKKGFTAITDFDSWNSEVGKAYVNSSVSKFFTNLEMKQCVECHTMKDVPVTCNTCHSRIVKPDSHKVSTFISSTHAKQATEDLTSCDRCHSVTSKYQGVVAKGVTIAEYARANTLCNTCHAETPAGHTVTWKKDHQYPAAKNPIQCMVCHNDAGARPGDNVPTTVTCQSCHRQSHKTFDVSRHKFKIPPSGYGAVCATCHNLLSCEKCHRKA